MISILCKERLCDFYFLGLFVFTYDQNMEEMNDS